MTRDVIGSVREPDDDAGTGGAGSGRGRRSLVLGAGALAVAVAALAWGGGGPFAAQDDAAPQPSPQATATATAPSTLPPAPVDVPLGEGLLATFGVAEAAPDPRRLVFPLRLSNLMPGPRTVDSIMVSGLGVTQVEVPSGTVLPAGGSRTFLVGVLADCGIPDDVPVTVVVDQRYAEEEPRAEVALLAMELPAPRAVLADLCPQDVPGLAVTATAARLDEDGRVTVRLVNNGGRSALVTGLSRSDGTSATAVLAADPPLPFDLAPGEDVVATMRVIVTACGRSAPSAAPGSFTPSGAASAAVELEARAPQGYTAVTDLSGPDGGLAGALDEAVRRAASRVCPTS